MAARWVEVTQERTVECLLILALLLRLGSLRADVVCDHGFNRELCVAVGVRGAQRTLLRNGNHVGEAGGVAVHGRRGGEDDVGDVVSLHRSQQSKSAAHVHTVVFQWDLAALADGFEGREVDDIVDVWVLVEDRIQALLIGNVTIVVFGTLAADQFDAIEYLLGGVVEVVDDDDLVVGLEKGQGGEGANVAGATVREATG